MTDQTYTFLVTMHVAHEEGSPPPPPHLLQELIRFRAPHEVSRQPIRLRAMTVEWVTIQTGSDDEV